LIRQLSIVYDTISGQLEARMMVEVKPCKSEGTGRVAMDPGETSLNGIRENIDSNDSIPSTSAPLALSKNDQDDQLQGRLVRD
jgi:hypothetical protein